MATSDNSGSGIKKKYTAEQRAKGRDTQRVKAATRRLAKSASATSFNFGANA
jgi:hypothetical protein